MSAPIFYISAEEYETLTPGASFELDGPEGKHALVKRMEVGESIDLGDGTGRRAVGTVHSLTDRGVIVRVEQLREEHTSPHIYLVQALAKDGRDLRDGDRAGRVRRAAVERGPFDCALEG